MTPSSRSTKPLSPLSPAMRRRADLYFLAASAAGIGLHVIAQPAQAEIVYTPAHVTFSRGGQILLDLNHDGIADFHLVAFLGAFGSVSYLVVHGLDSAAGACELNRKAWTLPPGAKIGPAQAFSNDPVMVEQYYGSSGGTWGKHHYLGLRFKINGEAHYGWAEFSVGLNQDRTLTAKLEGYAYETVANKTIIAGQKESSNSPVAQTPPSIETARGTIPVLALGYTGLSMWRREQLAQD